MGNFLQLLKYHGANDSSSCDNAEGTRIAFSLPGRKEVAQLRYDHLA